ncbi:MAG: hypothetical protein IMW90_03305 [Thermogemmatispora sp.]|uniref:Uncharacterized protein n=1 Tax=Thermogemmatispora aurantia TaxID=2045279 RepID=A0A5J4K628_9CHLR|nr:MULTISPECIES: hypothetical protein [Thermogemmatispora]MBE3564734.1 hypothetical protein [Thermogemmatispora sp.]GER82522.1 hypothetical protein KTAU_11590 [Thermogemmatispora aurantia]
MPSSFPSGDLSSFRLDPHKLRWLLWLRWRLFVRGLTRSPQNIVSFAVGALFLVACCGSTAFALTIAYRMIAPPGNVELLYVVLTAITLLWIILPVFQYGQNEGLDISKLLQFPLTRGEMMVGLLIAQLIDLLSFGLMLWLITIILGFTLSPGLLLLNIVATLIFLGFVVSCSQLVMALLSGLLQNRRFRDLSYIVIILGFTLFYIAQQLLLRGVFLENFTKGLMQRQYSHYLAWLPPGWIAQAIEAGLNGNWLASLGWLLLALLLTLILLYLWLRVLERVVTQPEVGGRSQAGRVSQRAGPVVSGTMPSAASAAEVAATPVLTQGQVRTSWFARFLSSQTLAIAAKDLRYFRRDPQLLGQLIMPLVVACVALVAPFLGRNAGRVTEDSWFFLFYPPFIVFLYLSMLSINALGLERKPLTVLFLYPIKPERLFFGKNLAVLVPGLVLLLAMLAFESLFLGLWHLVLPFLVAGLASIGIVLGWGNLTSVFFPQPVIQRRGMLLAGSASYSGAGCTRGLFQLLILAISLVSLAPVILAMILPMWLNMTWLWIVSVPVSLAYGLAFYLLLTRFVAAPALLRRGPEILEAVVRD